MSETVLPKELPPKEPKESLKSPGANLGPGTPAQPPRAGSGRGASGLALLALLLAVAGVGAAGWGVWQVRSLMAGHEQQAGQLQELRLQARSLGQGEEQLNARLSQLPAADELEERRRLVAQLQGDQQRLSQRLETVLGASRKDWRLAEAEHLLRLGSLRLAALQDVSSATSLVQGADEILRDQDDPGAFAAREQLAKSLAALHSIQQPDRTGLYLQLAALREQAAQLTALAPEFQTQGEAQRSLAAGEQSRWRVWWDKISSYFRVDFRPDDNLRPLLAGQGLNQVRLALSLSLEQAQWAALNGEAKVYTQSLEQARSILKGSFNADNTQSQALLASIDDLKGRPVSVVTPDLSTSLGAVQAYLERRQPVAADEAGKAKDEGQTP
ncbi:uroporphyrinogen-III C-methyltransferase [Pseudomonas sp. HR96]|uniref:uroporphyrinogen-III C-methyltransferase n=1 Tax=Pseudomonas sp. HR96 TaxID=1027966 RepID=UPI0039BE562F